MADAKITALTALTDPAVADIVPVVDDVAGTPITKKATLQVIADLFAGLTQTLAGKTLTSPILQGTVDGWVSASETWTYVSADDPTFTFTVNADVTTKYSPGMRVKLTQTTAKYFIITAVSSYSGGNTTITVYGGTDYDLANAAITSPYYSTQKAPVGFPLAPSKWTESTTVTANSTVGTSSWGSLGVSLVIPIGVWKTYYKSTYQGNGAGDNITIVYLSLSTTTSHLDEFTTHSGSQGTFHIHAGFAEAIIALTSKTTYYLTGKYLNGSGNTGGELIAKNDGTGAPTIIRAVCAYL